MADVNRRAYDTDVLDTVSKPVMVGDGAMDTRSQAELLNDTRPELIRTECVRLQFG